MKLDKILISIALVLLLSLILTLGYLFVKSKLNLETNIIEQKEYNEEEKILNLNKEKEIKNPSKEDVSNLIESLKQQNKELDTE